MFDDHTTLTFRDICTIFASTGTSDLYQQVVAAVPLTQREKLYLQCWQLSDSHEEHEWSYAADCLIEMEVAGHAWYLAHEERLTTPRRKRPWVKWLLGNTARELGAESEIHYRQALTFLKERRMNDPWLYVRLLCDLGRTYQVASTPQAHLLYEQALRLCVGEIAEHPARADLHEGLLWTNQQMEHYTQAVRHGAQALQLHQDDRSRARVWEMLGGVHLRATSYEDALHAYHQMHQIAEHLQEQPLLARSLMGLAQVHLAAGQGMQARSHCIKALELSDLPSAIRGNLFQMCAQVARAQASQSTTPQTFHQEAIACSLKALTLLGEQAGVLASLADLLEEMVAQDPTVVAQPLWQQAYTQLWKSGKKKGVPRA
ncbi:MAG TPA: hypothetical protein VHD63_03625 [Ktedonobacteraceae bacterium]|nr:hypothetical protein [Ktedonobacteraceae bacterium]